MNARLQTILQIPAASQEQMQWSKPLLQEHMADAYLASFCISLLRPLNFFLSLFKK